MKLKNIIFNVDILSIGCPYEIVLLAIKAVEILEWEIDMINIAKLYKLQNSTAVNDLLMILLLSNHKLHQLLDAHTISQFIINNVICISSPFAITLESYLDVNDSNKLHYLVKQKVGFTGDESLFVSY